MIGGDRKHRHQMDAKGLSGPMHCGSECWGCVGGRKGVRPIATREMRLTGHRTCFGSGRPRKASRVPGEGETNGDTVAVPGAKIVERSPSAP